MYRFDKKAERFEWMGAAHAYEVSYTFNNVSANDYLGDIDPWKEQRELTAFAYKYMPL